jgi:2'-5' RNA ligase
MTDFARYFLAIIPSEPIREEVKSIKTHFLDKYGCKAPLRSPGHITLHMPFSRKVSKEARLIETLGNMAFNEESFDMTLNGFGAFAPRTIYIAVDKSQALMDLQKRVVRCAKRELSLFNSEYKDRAYHAHMTVAFRDLKKAVFPQAWAEFKDRPFNAKFTVSSFWLLKHDGKQWHQHTEFLFRNKL